MATAWLRSLSPGAGSTPVFVDGSGRRRWVWRVIGLLLALLCAAVVTMIVMAVLMGSPTSLTPGASPSGVSVPQVSGPDGSGPAVPAP